MNLPKPSPTAPNPKTRRSLAAALAACAVAGAWTAWQRPFTAAPPNPPGSPNDPLAPLWSLELPLLDGRIQSAKSWRGRPLVVNFWATWCPPCIEELPLLDTFYRQKRAKGWQMIAIAADSETKVKDFLIKHPMQIPVAVIGAEAITLSKALGNLVGGLPFTLVLDSKSEVVQRRAGQIKPADIDNWLRIT